MSQRNEWSGFKGLTEEQAIQLAGSGWWEDLPHFDRALFQLFEERLCMPFGAFHESVEKALGRPVFTHEFAWPDLLRAELLGDRPRPTEAEVLSLIPAEKLTLIGGLT